MYFCPSRTVSVPVAGSGQAGGERELFSRGYCMILLLFSSLEPVSHRFRPQSRILRVEILPWLTATCLETSSVVPKSWKTSLETNPLKRLKALQGPYAMDSFLIVLISNCPGGGFWWSWWSWWSWRWFLGLVGVVASHYCYRYFKNPRPGPPNQYQDHQNHHRDN